MIVENILAWLPATEGRIVAMVQLQGDVLLATERSVFRLREDFYTNSLSAERLTTMTPRMPSPI